MPTPGGGNSTTGVVFEPELALGDLHLGDRYERETADGSRTLVVTRPHERALVISVEPVTGADAPRGIRSARLEVVTDRWDRPWRFADITFDSTAASQEWAMQARLRFEFLPPGLAIANHRLPRRLPFEAGWLPAPVGPSSRPGPSSTGYSPAFGHWTSNDNAVSIDVYANVVRIGGGDRDRIEAGPFGVATLHDASEGLSIVHFVVHDHNTYCAYALASTIDPKDLRRVYAGLRHR